MLSTAATQLPLPPWKTAARAPQSGRFLGIYAWFQSWCTSFDGPHGRVRPRRCTTHTVLRGYYRAWIGCIYQIRRACPGTLSTRYKDGGVEVLHNPRPVGPISRPALRGVPAACDQSDGSPRSPCDMFVVLHRVCTPARPHAAVRPIEGSAPGLKPGVNPQKSSTLGGARTVFQAGAAEVVLRPSITSPKRRPQPSLELVGRRVRPRGTPVRRAKSWEFVSETSRNEDALDWRTYAFLVEITTPCSRGMGLLVVYFLGP